MRFVIEAMIGPSFSDLGALREPFRVGHERRPFRLALGERVPRQEVIEVLVRVADEDGPEPRLPDAVALPQIASVTVSNRLRRAGSRPGTQ